MARVAASQIREAEEKRAELAFRPFALYNRSTLPLGCRRPADDPRLEPVRVVRAVVRQHGLAADRDCRVLVDVNREADHRQADVRCRGRRYDRWWGRVQSHRRRGTANQPGRRVEERQPRPTVDLVLRDVERDYAVIVRTENLRRRLGWCQDAACARLEADHVRFPAQRVCLSGRRRRRESARA